jgi:hypothetical protein
MSSKSLSSWQIHRYWWESSRSSAIQCFLIMLNEGHVVNAYIPWLYWKDESVMRNTYSHDFLFVPGQKSARFPLEEKYFRWSVCVLWQNSSSVNARLSLFCRHGCRVFEDSPQCVHSLNVATSNIRLLSLCWFSGGSRLGEQWWYLFPSWVKEVYLDCLVEPGLDFVLLFENDSLKVSSSWSRTLAWSLSGCWLRSCSLRRQPDKLSRIFKAVITS